MSSDIPKNIGRVDNTHMTTCSNNWYGTYQVKSFLHDNTHMTTLTWQHAPTIDMARIKWSLSYIINQCFFLTIFTPLKINVKPDNHPIQIRNIIWTKPPWLWVQQPLVFQAARYPKYSPSWWTDWPSTFRPQIGILHFYLSKVDIFGMMDWFVKSADWRWSKISLSNPTDRKICK